MNPCPPEGGVQPPRDVELVTVDGLHPEWARDLEPGGRYPLIAVNSGSFVWIRDGAGRLLYIYRRLLRGLEGL